MHKFCPECGKPATPRPELCADSWEAFAYCAPCSIMYIETMGDAQGGGRNTITAFNLAAWSARQPTFTASQLDELLRKAASDVR